MADANHITSPFPTTSFLLYLAAIEASLGERLSTQQKLMAVDCFQNDLEVFEAALRIYVRETIST